MAKIISVTVRSILGTKRGGGGQFCLAIWDQDCMGVPLPQAGGAGDPTGEGVWTWPGVWTRAGVEAWAGDEAWAGLWQVFGMVPVFFGKADLKGEEAPKGE
jgi:hypothetical protein